MKSIGYYLYNIIAVPLMYAGFAVASLAKRKIRLGLRGRRNLFRELERKMSAFPKKGPRFWIHSSSMGEFEQAKPVVAHIKKRYPEGIVVVSLFSPSAFEHIKDYQDADCLCYIPFDSRKRADRFISLIRPDVAVIVRHDFWPNHLYQLNRHGIPSVLINCSISAHSVRWFPFTLPFFRFLYGFFDEILTVSSETKKLFESHRLGRDRVDVAGDTRYDQVIRRAEEADEVVAPLKKLRNGRTAFVMGSTWPSDEEVLFDALIRLYHENIKLWILLIPHEPTDERLNQIEMKLSGLNLRTCRLSEVEAGDSGDCDVLLVDRVGMLASLYALGDMSYVGGGFGAGIHNVLEPAALGKIVFFGPKCHNSYEASLLQKRGVGFVVRNGEGLFRHLSSLMKDTRQLNEIGEMAARLVRENAGATQRIIEHLERLVPPR